jgi:hypothetical protein
MPERRYSDNQVAAIFKDAAEKQHASPFLESPARGSALRDFRTEGMTLAELQDIGREVGIPAELVADAARAMENRGRSWVRRFLGLPLRVGRTVPLGRRLSDAEWERLVVDLRETFDARGRLRSDGSFRQWTNGNLQALLEPTPNGHQLRLKTMKGNSLMWMTTGLATMGLAGVAAAFRALAGEFGDSAALATVAALGLAMFGLGAAQLPAWARKRERQMEEIAERLTRSTE